MSDDQDAYDPSQEKHLKKEKPYKLKTSKNQLKKLKLNRILQEDLEDEDNGKPRRICLEQKRGYYEDSNLYLNEDKGKRYWYHLDQKYFKCLNVDDYNQMVKKIYNINWTLSLGEQDSFENKSQNYKHSILNQYYHEIFEHKTSIKVLFSYSESNNVLVFYRLYQNPFLQQNLEIRLDFELCAISTTMIDNLLLEFNNTDTYQDQLDKQTAICERLLIKIQQQNQTMWSQMKDRVTMLQDKTDIDQNQLKIMNQKLYWSTITKLFKKGYKDKSRQNFVFLNPTQETSDNKQQTTSQINNKQNVKNQKDCKICFCGPDSESYSVVECQMCKTSFHLVCYGLRKVPKTQRYYCQVCTQYKQQRNIQKIYCRICERTGYPMKKMDNCFYHVSCLILNNFVQYKNYELKLKQQFTSQRIAGIVVDAEQRQQNCCYCNEPFGLKLDCCFEGCQKYFHSTCAYMHGCSFQLNISQYFSTPHFQVQSFCPCHSPNRNHIEQIYYRRFDLDFNKICLNSLQQFIPIYAIQLNQIELAYNSNPKIPLFNILKLNKFMKDYRAKTKQKKRGRKPKSQSFKFIMSNCQSNTNVFQIIPQKITKKPPQKIHQPSPQLINSINNTFNHFMTLNFDCDWPE